MVIQINPIVLKLIIGFIIENNLSRRACVCVRVYVCGYVFFVARSLSEFPANVAIASVRLSCITAFAYRI